MKTTMALSLLAAISSATPLSRRQFSLGSSTSTDLVDGQCGDVVFIFARGSTETGNMGSTVGPPTCSALQESYDVACQGVGGAYTADLFSNALPDGTSSAALEEAAEMFSLAQSQCPDTPVVAAGYSQGAALIAGAVSRLDATLMSQVKGVVLYGYTKNLQNDGGIPNYPQEQTKVFCNASDGVCSGALLVTAGHLTYTADVQEAAAFLESQIGA